MGPQARAHVFWVFAYEDEPVARELLQLASVLEAQGLLTNHKPVAFVPVGSFSDERLSNADVVMVLCSPAFLERADGVLPKLLASSERARIVPVILSPVVLPPGLDALPSFPRGGNSIVASLDRAASLLDVIRGLQEIVELRRASTPRAVTQARPGTAVPGLPITKIFELEGPPTFTFVEPPRFAELKLALRTMGSGLIVEGPSKVGKSTAVRKAMDELDVPKEHQVWWHGQAPPPLEDFHHTLRALSRATRDTWLFIDDFHHLGDPEYLHALASAMKVLADQPERHAKITLIGINPLGDSLVQVMPDLSGRFRVLRLDIDKDWRRSTKIAELIIRGETAANIRFAHRDDFVLAADGSFFLAQYLCYFAAVKAGVHEVPEGLVDIDLGPADVISAIQGELATRFRAPLRDFAAYDAAAPPRGAGLSLLWLLSRSGDGCVPVREARLRFPMLAGAFDWLLESNLTRCLQSNPRLKGLLYYNRPAQILTMEDPQLKFYLRELDWEEFARASGHSDVRVHSEDGPLWPLSRTAPSSTDVLVSAGTSAGTAVRTSARSIRVLHLSDLHFATKDQSTLWYSQLAADLRQQQVEHLDLLVVSGDLVERADPAEYDAARLFLEKLMGGFSISPRQVVLVPGNHDVSWPLAKQAYRLHLRTDYKDPLEPGTYVEHGTDVIGVRDEDAYRERFKPFAELYRTIKGVDYPLAPEAQGIVYDEPELGLCVLGLNSAWETDPHYPSRASIHPGALAHALVSLESPSHRGRDLRRQYARVGARISTPVQSPGDRSGARHDRDALPARGERRVGAGRAMAAGARHGSTAALLHRARRGRGRLVAPVTAAARAAPPAAAPRRYLRSSPGSGG